MKAFYCDDVQNFLKQDEDFILGKLTSNYGSIGYLNLINRQINAWKNEILILKKTFEILNGKNENVSKWGILLEYPIPRRNKRIDIVLIIEDKIVIIETKINATSFTLSAEDQLLDYCLDLRDFHLGSLNCKIYPLLLSTDVENEKHTPINNNNLVQPLLYSNKSNLVEVILSISEEPTSNTLIDYHQWDTSIYAPTLNIIEAACKLYQGQQVSDITRNQAGVTNINVTSKKVSEIIENTQSKNKKSICFITGVPGAGKTLVGLNIVHNEQKNLMAENIISFLSGNGPLVKVLREALAMDYNKENGISLKEARRKVETFISNVHIFINDFYENPEKVPQDKIIVFDEAQRAWNSEQSKKKFDRDLSEPELILEIMNRHKDWVVIVALIGGGQEINTGEAGLREWGKILEEKYNDWDIYISPKLVEGDSSTANLTLFEEIPKKLNIKKIEELHLNVSVRALRATNLADWVENVLNGNSIEANKILNEKLKRFPLFITRSLENARNYLKYDEYGFKRLGRYGILASSGFRRGRAYGIDVTMDLDVAKWFLANDRDVRSSNFLELPVTEFGVQGLELDNVCLCWGDDLRRENENWTFNSFKGSKWQKVNKTLNKQFIINKYRVLLTRAREGMIIWVPIGSDDDVTRKREFYEGTFQYLKDCGLKEIRLDSSLSPE